MKQRILALLLALTLGLGLLTACGSTADSRSVLSDELHLIESAKEPAVQAGQAETALEPAQAGEPDPEPAHQSTETVAGEAAPEEQALPADAAESSIEETEDGMPPALWDEEDGEDSPVPAGPADVSPEDGPSETPAEERAVAAPTPSAEPVSVDEDGEYTTPEDVALYIYSYGHLPSNFIRKSKAQELGWDSSRGNLWDVAPGKSIGGDRFGNYEGRLPDSTTYKECDVNYAGGYRGAERIIYGADGSIYYTNDHYNTFTRLY